MNTKCCSRCKKHFPQSQQYFYRNKNSKDGLNSYCKTCSKESQREWHKKTGGVAIPKCLPGFKWCNTCQACLPATSEFFNNDKSKKDGFCSTCKKCNKRRSKKWYKKNCHPKNIPPKTYEPGEQKVCTKCRKSFPATLDYFCRDNLQHSGFHPWCKKCAYQKSTQWAKKNKKKVANNQRKYRKNNPHVYQTIKERRRARINNCSGDVTPIEWQAIKKYYAPHSQCLACGKTKKMTMDHVHPISKNGLHLSFNVQPICRSCNSKKQTKYIDYRPDKGRFAMLVFLGNILKG